MDLESYLAKYGPEWRRLEGAVARGAPGLARLPGPELREIVRLYLRASSHLAEVQTRYRDPAVLAYLNAVVARAHGAIYSAAPRSLADGARLFGARYREGVRRTVPFVLAAAAVLAATALAVGLWVAGSEEARAGLVPPIAREAIERATGSPADAGVDPAQLSTFILVNNVQVAFLSFALGIALGIGTLWVLVQNGLLIGALAGGFAAGGKAGIFWSLVLPHGLLELTAIFIAAGAGLRMGWSLIDPGERPRGEALAEEARDASLVVLGVVPAFVVAAVIEGFVTGSSLPAPVELGIGVAAAAGYVAFLLGPAGLRDLRRYSLPRAFTRR